MSRRDGERRKHWKNLGVDCPECGHELRVGVRIYSDGTFTPMGWAPDPLCVHSFTYQQVKGLIEARGGP